MLNTTVPTVTGRLDHPSHPVHQPASPTPRRVNLLDRAALHVGIALIRWGRRPRQAESRERRARRYEQQLARLERERVAEREYRLGVPPR